MAENVLIATQDLTVCGDTINRSVAAVDVRHLPQPTGSAAVASRVRRPLGATVRYVDKFLAHRNAMLIEMQLAHYN